MSKCRELLEQTTAAISAASVQVAQLIDVVMYRGPDTLSDCVVDSLPALVLKHVAIASGAPSAVAGWRVRSTALGRVQIRRTPRLGTASVQGDRL